MPTNRRKLWTSLPAPRHLDFFIPPVLHKRTQHLLHQLQNLLPILFSKYHWLSGACKSLFANKISNLDFPLIAKQQFG
jgi:hypothetical protein